MRRRIVRTRDRQKDPDTINAEWVRQTVAAAVEATVNAREAEITKLKDRLHATEEALAVAVSVLCNVQGSVGGVAEALMAMPVKDALTELSSLVAMQPDEAGILTSYPTAIANYEAAYKSVDINDPVAVAAERLRLVQENNLIRQRLHNTMLSSIDNRMAQLRDSDMSAEEIAIANAIQATEDRGL
ncbi:MAG: hypothetical protein LPH21_18420 [Shewanella sp.]|nr:hypothetical protein [Shewanella sp.]